MEPFQLKRKKSVTLIDFGQLITKKLLSLIPMKAPFNSQTDTVKTAYKPNFSIFLKLSLGHDKIRVSQSRKQHQKHFPVSISNV